MPKKEEKTNCQEDHQVQNVEEEELIGTGETGSTPEHGHIEDNFEMQIPEEDIIPIEDGVIHATLDVEPNVQFEEDKGIEEERLREEEKRNELERLELLRQEEEARVAEEDKRIEEERLLEEERRIELERLELLRQEEETRVAEENRLKEEEARAAEEASLRKIEEDRIEQEERLRREKEAQLTEQERKRKEAEERVVAFENKVEQIDNNFSQISSGKLKVVNRLEFDRLIEVRGKARPIAVYVPTRSESLSVSGAFIYDTTRLDDNTLYLFAGPQCDNHLINLAENLLQLMLAQCPTARTVRIIRDIESDDFTHMIHEIGGTKTNIQSAHNHGDQLLFERQFYMTLLQIHTFVNGQMKEFTVKKPSMSVLPSNGAAVIDMSDRALYFWIANYHHPSEQDDADVQMGLKWVNDQSALSTREITVFTADFVPPNVAVIFGS